MIEILKRLSDKKSVTVAGLMSGTSMDGIDVIITELTGAGVQTGWEIKYFNTYPLSDWVIEKTINGDGGSAKEVCQLNFDIGREFSKSLENALNESGIEASELDLIGSHGQTIYHIDGESTLQVGEPSVLAEAFGVPVIADFRVRDIAAGGNGAPLVPYVDYILFGKEGGKSVLNIGGIANFTILPSGIKSISEISAWDAGPGNMLIDRAAVMVSDGELRYDLDGKLGSEGEVNEKWLKSLMAHPYINKPPPKSAGREDFGKEYFDEIVSSFDISSHQDKLDLIATLTRFTVEAIHSNYKMYAPGNNGISEMVLSGGGVHNPLLMGHLESLFKPMKIKRIDEYGISSDAKEAFAFAVLANEFIAGNRSNVPQVTGARDQVLLGKLTI